MRIAVFRKNENPNIQRASRHVKKSVAHLLIAEGRAVPVRYKLYGGSAIQLTTHIVLPKDPLRCGQAVTYEKLAIEMYPQIFLGGLTRTEHKPAVLKKFHGARVAH